MSQRKMQFYIKIWAFLYQAIVTAGGFLPAEIRFRMVIRDATEEHLDFHHLLIENSVISTHFAFVSQRSFYFKLGGKQMHQT